MTIEIGDRLLQHTLPSVCLTYSLPHHITLEVMGPGAYNCHPVNLTGYTRRHGAYGYCEHGALIALVSENPNSSCSTYHNMRDNPPVTHLALEIHLFQVYIHLQSAKDTPITKLLKPLYVGSRILPL